MSFASIQKEFGSIDVTVVEHEVSSDKERRCVSLENCCVCDTPLHHSRLPQLFPCLHSACNTCLSEQRVEDDKKTACPICKRFFGIAEITENVIFKHSLPMSGKGDVFKCGGCEVLAVSGWCKDCGESLCSDCVSAHNRVKLTRSHIIVPQELSTDSHPTLYCSIHRDEPLKFFCVTCSQLTCRNCQLVEHRNHSYQMLSEAKSALKEKLQSLQGKVTHQKEKVKQSLFDLDQRLLSITKLKMSLKKKLSLVVSKVYRHMLMKAVQLFQTAMAAYGKEEQELSNRKATLTKLEERQDYLVSFIDKTLSIEGHAGVLLKNRIESQIKDLLFQSVLPAHSMLELKVQVNQTIMTTLDNFGGISLKLVPFARNQSCQSESQLESVPNLQNVPKNYIIETVTCTASPDSSAQIATAFFSQSSTAPLSHHSQSYNAPIGLPQSAPGSSNASQHQSSSSVGLHFSHASLPQPHINGPNLQIHNAVLPLPITTACAHQHNAVLPLSVPTTSSHQHNAVLPLPVPTTSAHQHQAVLPLPLQVTSAHQHNAVLPLPLPVTSAHQHQAVLPLPVPTTSAHQHNAVLPLPLPVTSAHQHNAVLPLPVPTTSAHQHQAQTALLVLPSPVTCNPPKVLCAPLLCAQSAPQVQAHSTLANFQPLPKPCPLMKPQLTASPLDQPPPLLSDLKQEKSEQQSFTKHLQAQTQSNKSHPPPSELAQQMQVSSDDAQHPQSSRTASSKSLGPQTLSAVKLLLLQKQAPRHFKRRSKKSVDLEKKTWIFHGYQPSPMAKQTKQPSLSDRNASEPSPADLPDLQNNRSVTRQESTSHTVTQCQDQPLEQKDTQPQLTKDALKLHYSWLSGLPKSFHEILGVPPLEKWAQDTPQTDLSKTDDPQKVLVETDSVSSGKAVYTAEMKSCTLPENMLQCQVDLVRLDIKLPPAGHPLPRFRVGKDGSYHMMSLQKEELLQELSGDSENSGSALSLGSAEIDFHCEVCDTGAGTLMCMKCGRGFHRDCHVPPVTTQVCHYRWICTICQDLSDSADPFSRDRLKKPCLSLMDQRRCEHLILALMCKNKSCILYSKKDPSSSVDFSIIHGRLLRKKSPPYRTPSELVSDIWVLLDSLLSSSKETDNVLKMQKFFEKRVNKVFGTILHPSLRTRPNVKKEKDVDNTGEQIKREMLKRENDSSEDLTEPTVKKSYLG